MIYSYIKFVNAGYKYLKDKIILLNLILVIIKMKWWMIQILLVYVMKVNKISIKKNWNML